MLSAAEQLALAEDTEGLQGLGLDETLVEGMLHGGGFHTRALNLHVPTFKHFETRELAPAGASRWPAISITGAHCALQCDHCKAEILKPMVAATTPQQLWTRICEFADQGAGGILLSGGSDHGNRIHYEPFLPVVSRAKERFPGLRIAVHTALVDRPMARALEQAGVDVAMLDVIGAQETITQVYHLKRSPQDFEDALAALCETSMRVVPHIVFGLHYGQPLGEHNALQMVRRHPTEALVLVVVMPFYANRRRPFETPDPHEAGRFFLHARRALADRSVLLGCARPPGRVRRQLDAYALFAGLDGIAHPSEGIVELAVNSGRPVRVSPSCCSIGLDSEDDMMGRELLQSDLRALQSSGSVSDSLAGIPVVSGSC